MTIIIYHIGRVSKFGKFVIFDEISAFRFKSVWKNRILDKIYSWSRNIFCCRSYSVGFR
jgi:hypothetical protein